MKALATGLLASMLLVGLSAAADLSMHVSANRPEMYIGESVVLTVKVRGGKKPPEPDLSQIADFDVQSRGRRSSSHLSIGNVNGRMVRTIVRETIFTYELTPRAQGTFRAGPVRLAGGRALVDMGPSIRVQGIEKQEWVEIQISPTRESVLVDEPFGVTLSIFLRQLPPPYQDHHPLDANEAPLLEVPFLEQKAIDGLDIPDVRGLVQRHLVQAQGQPGFRLNKYTLRSSPFDSFFAFDPFNEQPAKVMFPKSAATRDGKGYHEYRIRLDYVAKKDGSYTFGPAIFKGPVIVKVNPGGRIATHRVFAVGPAVTVRVEPPPEENRPASFIGAIGTNMSVTASLDKQTCNVGDPLSLTLTIAGDISIDNIVPPELGIQPDLLRDFRVYDDTVHSQPTDEGKTYVYRIRPTRAGTYEVPPIEVSYYDAGERVYKSVFTRPIPIKAHKAADVMPTDIPGLQTNRMVVRTLSSGDDSRIAAPITMDPKGATADSLLRPLEHTVIAAAGPALVILVFVSRGLNTLRLQRAMGRRPRRALATALRLLKQAGRTNDPNAANRSVREAMSGYLADHFQLNHAGWTPEDIRRVLADNSVAPEIAGRFHTVFESTFNAEFSSSGTRHGTSDDHASEAERILVSMEQQC